MIIRDCETKDWSHAKKQGIEVWVYGYPRYKGGWVGAQPIATMYQEMGRERVGEFVEHLEGEFTILIMDRDRDYAFTSRFGMYSPYYRRDGSQVAISGTGFKGKLNDMKVLEYLTWGYGTTAMTLGDTTYVEGVKRFKPATIMDLHTGEERCYWNPFHQPRREEYVDFGRFTERFHSYMRDVLATRETFVTTVTGGLDTRTILAGYLAVKQRENVIRAFTHEGNAADTELSRQICRHYGIPHTVYKPASLDGTSDLLEGLVPGISYRPMTGCVELESQRGPGVLAVGLCGNEIWRGRLHIRVMEEYLRHPPAEALFKALCTSIYFPSLPPVYSVDAEAVILERTREILREAPAYAVDDPYWLADWFMWQHAVPNWAGTLARSMGKHFKLYLTMLSKDLVETMYATSMDVRRNGEHQRHIIGHASTFLGQTRYDTSAGFLKTKNTIVQAFRPLIRNRVAAGVLRQAKARGVVEDWYGSLVREMLDYDSMRLKHLFDRRSLKAYVESNINPPWVERLVSLEMYLRRVGL